MLERELTVSMLREPRRPRSYNESRPDRVVPYLRLKGQWLEALGFEVGETVRVATEPGRLVITPATSSASGVADA